MMKFILLVLVWGTSVVASMVTDWTLFESFVIITLSFICINRLEGELK